MKRGQGGRRGTSTPPGPEPERGRGRSRRNPDCCSRGQGRLAKHSYAPSVHGFALRRPLAVPAFTAGAWYTRRRWGCGTASFGKRNVSLHARGSGRPPFGRKLKAPGPTAIPTLCAFLTAGTLAGVLGPADRFATDAQLAAYAGVAPLEASSAGLVRHRLNRGGNRRLNAVFYRIVLTQAHHLPAARAYIDRRLTEGKTRREAHRALRRFVVRAIWRLWQECRPAQTAASTEMAG